MSERFFVGTRKGLFRYEKHEGKWRCAESSFLGDPVPMLLPDPRDGSVYVAVEHGHFGTKMHRSDDGGSTWTEIDPPVYPARPEDVPETIDPVRQTVIPWSLSKIWSLETGAGKGIWCGTLPGGLFFSENKGENWTINRPLWDVPERAKWMGGGYDLPGIHSIAVHPENPDDIAVGISCGGVWRTRDGGGSWTQSAHGMFYDFNPAEPEMDPDSQDPHRLVRCASAPDRMWVQHHCGIFQSSDDGTRWSKIDNVSPSGFGFAVAVHPRDPQTAWFVPAKKDEFRYPVDGRFVVTRTRDGGNAFETLTAGLPQESAYDLVYRHGLEVDETGTFLVMGSTTGSLWISEDSGDSWQAISHHLPPIYCVRI